jgi:hypothetical protein
MFVIRSLDGTITSFIAGIFNLVKEHSSYCPKESTKNAYGTPFEKFEKEAMRVPNIAQLPRHDALVSPEEHKIL